MVVGLADAIHALEASEATHAFRVGFDRTPRDHQIDVVRTVINDVMSRGDRRVLVQHAAGSGKTESIGLLALVALQKRLFSHVVILNYGHDLEDQALRRLSPFFAAHCVECGQATSTDDVTKRLRRGAVYFSLLQKFSDGDGDEDTESPKKKTKKGRQGFVQCLSEVSSRILVIVDEAHVGIPEEGMHMKALEARYGADHTQVLFTATPKVQTLLSHGRRLADGSCEAFHVHTQREAVAARYVLNPLEHYTNCVADLQVNGQKLAAMRDPVAVDTFLDQLNNQRKNKDIMLQRAVATMERMQQVYASCPVMVERRHQVKAMVVLPTVQAVYDFGHMLRSQAKGQQTPLQKQFQIGMFFSGTRAEKKSGGKSTMVTEQQANGGLALDDCDIIVTCKKYVTGYDEWRICAIFLMARLNQPEFLQQILGRATRARPGEGKRRPFVFDFANNPDTIFSSVMRFWDKTRHYPEPLGELKELKAYISTFKIGAESGCGETSLVAARRLTVSDQMLLRAALILYWRAAAAVSSSDTPLKFEWLRCVTEGLNLELKRQLYGNSEALARLAAKDAASGQEPRNSLLHVAGHVAAGQRLATSAPAALRILRSTLGLGRKRPQRRDATTPPPPKRARTAEVGDAPPLEKAEAAPATPVVEQPPLHLLTDDPAMTPVKRRSDSTVGPEEIEAGLGQAVDDVVQRYAKTLPKDGDPETPDEREAELERFDFASAPLKQFGAKIVKAARARLVVRLAGAFGECLKTWMTKQKEACEADFVQELGSQPDKDASLRRLDQAQTEFAEATAFIGGRVPGAFKRGMTKKLLKLVTTRFGAP